MSGNIHPLAARSDALSLPSRNDCLAPPCGNHTTSQ